MTNASKLTYVRFTERQRADIDVLAASLGYGVAETIRLLVALALGHRERVTLGEVREAVEANDGE